MNGGETCNQRIDFSFLISIKFLPPFCMCLLNKAIVHAGADSGQHMNEAFCVFLKFFDYWRDFILKKPRKRYRSTEWERERGTRERGICVCVTFSFIQYNTVIEHTCLCNCSVHLFQQWITGIYKYTCTVHAYMIYKKGTGIQTYNRTKYLINI